MSRQGILLLTFSVSIQKSLLHVKIVQRRTEDFRHEMENNKEEKRKRRGIEREKKERTTKEASRLARGVESNSSKISFLCGRANNDEARERFLLLAKRNMPSRVVRTTRSEHVRQQRSNFGRRR